MRTIDAELLSAFALGELTEAEREAVALAVGRDVGLKRALDEIVAASELVTAAFAAEPHTTFDAGRRTTVMQTASGTNSQAAPAAEVPSKWARLLSLPSLRQRPAVAAAGVLVVVLALWNLPRAYGAFVHSQIWLEQVGGSNDSNDSLYPLVAPEITTWGDLMRYREQVRQGDLSSMTALPPGGKSRLRGYQSVPPSLGEERQLAEETGQSALGSASPAVNPGPFPNMPADANRWIVKNADLTMEVAVTDRAISQIGTAAAAAGGYVVDTRLNIDEGVKYAMVSIAVPVEHFEATLARVRALASQLITEQATGTDVTEEFVDLQSQIANLEATQARIREFLSKATNVEEALRVNAQLSEIEGQLSQLKGRLEYLRQNSAYSTISVQLLEAADPTPTPTVTPTPTPTPAATWSPSEHATAAWGTLRGVLQGLATAGIWFGIVVIPLGLPIVLALPSYRRWRGR